MHNSILLKDWLACDMLGGMQVTYDPKQVSYEQLLQAFVKGHNPTQADGQGHDRGSQYRSGIYTHTPEQKRIAEEFMQRTQADYQARPYSQSA